MQRRAVGHFVNQLLRNPGVCRSHSAVGVIVHLSLLFELGETDEEGVTRRVEAIGGRLSALWARARSEGVAPHRLADRIAEERLAAARKEK